VAGLILKPVWTLWRRAKYLALPGTETRLPNELFLLHYLSLKETKIKHYMI
jgi:hypothetical protein